MIRALKFCNHPGCNNLTTDKYCDEHKQDEADKLKRLDRRRSTAQERGYDYRWSKVRTNYIRKNPLCAICLEHGKVTPATVVHHKIPIDKGGPILDTNNLQALCRDCHEILHGRKRNTSING